MFVSPKLHGSTKARLLAAASELFAEHGYHGSTMRDIALHAGVNLAAANYHYGSKKELYLEVLRAMFAEIRAELARRGAVALPGAVAHLSRTEVEALLAARIGGMLALLLGPPPSLHGTLMQREMTDPSEALPVIVDEFMAPMEREVEDILRRLCPHLDPQTLQHCAFSIIGQVVFYRLTMPGLLRMFRWSAYPGDFAAQLAEHITAFSLGGLEALGTRPVASAAARRRSAGRTRLAARRRSSV